MTPSAISSDRPLQASHIIRLGPVLLFYVLAIGISGPFFYWRSVLAWKGFPGPGFLKTPSYMWGPGIAGIICYLIYRHTYRKQITVWGRSLVQSLIIWFAPLFLLAALGIQRADGSLDHVTPLQLSVLAFFSIWGEEVGWRWYLQDYLSPMRPFKKYLLIGVLWELWHLRFLGRLHDPLLSVLISSAIMLLVVIGLAIIIGMVTDRTRSLFFACTLHGWVDLCAEMPGLHTYIAAGVMLLLCGYFYFTSRPVAEDTAIHEQAVAA